MVPHKRCRSGLPCPCFPSELEGNWRAWSARSRCELGVPEADLVTAPVTFRLPVFAQAFFIPLQFGHALLNQGL
jgi:hypothetical protein